MAMNKREQAEMETLRHELALARALHHTALVEPDIDPGMEGGTIFGFTARMDGPLISRQRPDVRARWSTAISHGNAVWNDGGYDRDPRHCGTQGALRMHTTEARALRALRNQVERKAAEELAAIDAMITKLETDKCA